MKLKSVQSYINLPSHSLVTQRWVFHSHDILFAWQSWLFMLHSNVMFSFKKSNRMVDGCLSMCASCEVLKASQGVATLSRKWRIGFEVAFVTCAFVRRRGMHACICMRASSERQGKQDPEISIERQTIFFLNESLERVDADSLIRINCSLFFSRTKNWSVIYLIFYNLLYARHVTELRTNQNASRKLTNQSQGKIFLPAR